MSRFDKTINALPNPGTFPAAMIVTHLTLAKWFKSIVKAGELEPRQCAVFGEKILYLFYGGVFYRPQDAGPSRKPPQLPIAFVFHPNVLKKITRFYPFDTGAMAGGKFDKWCTVFSKQDHLSPLWG